MKIKSVSQEDWLNHLFNPQTEVKTDLHSVAGYLRRARPIRFSEPLNQHLFYYVVSGKFKGFVGTTKFHAEESDLIWFLPHMSFRDELIGNRPVIVYRFRLRVISNGVLLYPHIKHPLYSKVPECRIWLEKIVAETAKTESLSNIKIRSLLGCLFTDLFRSETKSEAPSRQLSPKQREEISNYFLSRASEPINPSALARHMRLSPDYFTRLFQKTYGVPPRRWMVQERIRLAALRLIETQQNISEVAEEFGYRDLFFFSRQFKMVMGESPSQYRASHADIS